jgi:hypothetical protein
MHNVEVEVQQQIYPSPFPTMCIWHNGQLEFERFMVSVESKMIMIGITLKFHDAPNHCIIATFHRMIILLNLKNKSSFAYMILPTFPMCYKINPRLHTWSFLPSLCDNIALTPKMNQSMSKMKGFSKLGHNSIGVDICLILLHQKLLTF